MNLDLAPMGSSARRIGARAPAADAPTITNQGASRDNRGGVEAIFQPLAPPRLRRVTFREPAMSLTSKPGYTSLGNEALGPTTFERRSK
jgi:hypothetical protein